MSQRSLRLVGGLFWVAAILVAIVSLGGYSRGESDVSLLDYFVGTQQRLVAEDGSERLRPDDPIFHQDANGRWQQVGYIASSSATDLDLATPKRMVEIIWYSTTVRPDQCRLTMHENDGRLESIITTMFTAEKRRLIEQRLTEVMRQHGDELSATFIPLVETTLQESLPIIEQEIELSIARHREEIDRLSSRWNEEFLQSRLIPLARSEILPIIREHGEPTATAIGRELWENASLWRFGWRVAYDRSPLPQRNLAQQEWDRFVEDQAVPIFAEHMDEIVVAVQHMVADIVTNENVRKELASVVGEVTSDPETRKLIGVILTESLIENQQLRTAWGKIWTSDQARSALDLAGDRLEPVIRQIGDDLFGSRETGINPDFAKVLRNQILGKDRRWVVASPGRSAIASTIQPATEAMAYPVVHLANSNQQ